MAPEGWTSKWPRGITFMRHAQSAYNILRHQKAHDDTYRAFIHAYNQDYRSATALELAKRVKDKYSLSHGDWDTPATEQGLAEAYEVGLALAARNEPLPDVVFSSPYLRTMQTYEQVVRGWPALGAVRLVKDERLREQEHGLATIYNDWRVFHCFHPEQKELEDREGGFRYRYPQGENVPDVQGRIRSMIETWIRDYAGQDIYVCSHHLTILTTRITLERGGQDEFLELDKHNKPLNCSLTRYECNPAAGSQGKLLLKYYNQCLYAGA